MPGTKKGPYLKAQMVLTVSQKDKKKNQLQLHDITYASILKKSAS
jgi:hypothetical protein